MTNPSSTTAAPISKRRQLAGVALVLSILGGGAFAVANLDAANTVNLQQVLESVNVLPLPSNNAAPELQLFRSDTTRSSDTADVLLKRLGVDDSEAADVLRQSRVASKQLLGRPGKLVQVEANGNHRLTRMTARWLNDNGQEFTRWTLERTP